MKRSMLLLTMALGACAGRPSEGIMWPDSPTPVEEQKATAGVATSLAFVWTTSHGDTELPQHGGTVTLPIRTRASLKVYGLDAAGHRVQLGRPTFEGSGTWFSVNPTASPVRAEIVPGSDNSPYDPIVVRADADAGPGASFIWGHVQVRVVGQ